MANRNLVIENAQIAFRNFKGEESKFNAKGSRNFCVLLDDETAEPLADDGWNIKYLKPRDEEESPRPYLSVAVSFNAYPPKIVMITHKGKTLLDEETIDILDWAELENVDLIIRPYNWEVNGKTGVKAYVKAMYVTILEDEFAVKYGDVEDAKTNDIPF